MLEFLVLIIAMLPVINDGAVSLRMSMPLKTVSEEESAQHKFSVPYSVKDLILTVNGQVKQLTYKMPLLTSLTCADKQKLVPNHLSERTHLDNHIKPEHEAEKCFKECWKRICPAYCHGSASQLGICRHCPCYFHNFKNFNSYDGVDKIMANCLKKTNFLKLWKRRHQLFNGGTCGISSDTVLTEDPARPRSKVTNADNAEDPMRFPWSLRIVVEFEGSEEFDGSAVYIGHKFALTSAHIVENTALLGDKWTVKAAGGSDFRDKQHMTNVKRIHFTPSFNATVFPYNNTHRCLERPHFDNCIDIAVLELEEEIPNTIPICLPESTMTLGTVYLRLFGWGQAIERNWFWENFYDLDLPDELQWSDVAMEHDSCRRNMFKNHICTKGSYYTTQHISTCKGDSGSGLQCPSGDGDEWCHQKSPDGIYRWYLVGIVRGAIGSREARRHCNNTLDLYVDVRNQLPFICSIATGVC